MSVWNIGADDVTEEQQTFKSRLASKDTQIAAQQTQILRQAQELEDIKNTLNDALRKLHHETDRALSLESSLSRCNEDLQREKVASQNNEAALRSTQEKLKAKDLEARELESVLDSLSHQSDGHSANTKKLSQEKVVLETRVRELEARMALMTEPTQNTLPKRSGIPVRGRSSSMSNAKFMSLEGDFNGVKAIVQQKEVELRGKEQKLTNLQNELVKVGNEKMTMERRLKEKLEDVRAALEEKDNELQYLKSVQGDGGREEELMRRIEEDDARIEALESMLRDASELPALKDSLKRAEERLRAEKKKVDDSEFRNIELVNEKEQVLDDLDDARHHIETLNAVLEEKNAFIDRLQRTPSEPDFHHLPTVVVHGPDDEYPRSSTPIQIVPNDDTVRNIERLLAAIERLRDERDNLRGDVSFLQTESDFTIQSLESKIEALKARESDLQAEIDNLHGHLEEADEIIRDKEGSARRFGRGFLASLVSVQHLQTQTPPPPAPVDTLALCETEDKLKDVETKLSIATQCLADTTEERNDLMAQLDTRSSEWKRELDDLQSVYDEAKETIQQLDARLSDLSSALEDIESERNSLTVQVTNLTTDLKAAQAELSDAETRYSTLQFHQLANMSSSEATRVLKHQIQELESRVMRRTEQIGIHQHDIRRLETNLRLQEERLVEMTGEMETLASQKDAMVEDCADAREARDDAIAKVEKMELELETMEAKAVHSEKAVETLVGVVIQTVSNARIAANSGRERLVAKDAVLSVVREEYEQVFQTLTQKSAELSETQNALDESTDAARQATVALASSRIELGVAISSRDELLAANKALTIHLESLQADFDARCAESASLISQLEALRNSASGSESRFDAILFELREKLRLSEQSLVDSKAEHKRTIDELQREIAEKERLLSDNDLESQLVQLKMKHVEELGALQLHLVEANSALEQAQMRYADAEARYQQGLSNSTRDKEELEQSLRAASEAEAHLKEAEKQSAQRRAEDEKEIRELRRQLTIAEDASREARERRDELEVSYHRVKNELASVQEIRTTEREDLDVNLAALETKVKEQATQLQRSTEEAMHLREMLQEEVDSRNAEQEQHRRALQQLQGSNNCSEQLLVSLREENTRVREDLDQLHEELDMIQDDRTTLQQNLTALEAEYQRSIALIRYLERQVKEKEQSITSVSADLQRTLDDLARVEKSHNTAEVNLSLQEAQHKREMSQLQRELSSLKSRPNLENALADLEERNTEMEELLRRKCAEIEENDDKALEMLKQNKKLASKAEALNRKVQNLQTKLAAAKASLPSKASPESAKAESPPPVPSISNSSRQRATTMSSSSTPSAPPLPPSSYSAPSMPTSRGSASRAVSGPSSLPRPKTPERRSALSVFNPRSPEKHQPTPETQSSTPGTMASRKRPPPEDYDSIVSKIPAQAFTPDCVRNEPEAVSTPRVRRVLSSLQSGFTPVRHQTGRPIAPLPSPRRSDYPSESPFMADLTNNPRSVSHMAFDAIAEKPSKRSWLGKIRGVSTIHTTGAPTGRPMPSRPLADRFLE